MGTRGLKVVRFRGRCFVYWNQYDSYPETLGQMLVNEIPDNPKEYKLWLERERAVYEQMIADLDTILIVTDEKIATDLKRGASAVIGVPRQATPPLYTAKDEALRPYDTIDDRLKSFPNYFSSEGIDIWVEWMYTIDLDREVFLVNSQKTSAQFTMDNIPRKNWASMVEGSYDRVLDDDDCDEKDIEKEDDEEKENGNNTEKLAYSSKPCPKADDVDLEESYLASQTKSQIDRSSKTADLQLLSVVLFEKLITPSVLHLNTYLPNWTTKDIAFQEIAFTILSFAAGQYRMIEPQNLTGAASNGYILHNDGVEQEVLPVFGSGCRRPGGDPYSSPRGTKYWFENVLVSLVPQTIIRHHADVAIVEVVEFGLAAGNDDFYSIVFSLTHAIMLHVTVEKGVKTVSRTPLTEIMDHEGPIREDNDSFYSLCEMMAGFISLIHFFDAAAIRYVTPFGQGCFPTEIYSGIHSYVDDHITYNSLAKSSKVFRDIRPGMMTFGSHLKTPKLCPGRHSGWNEWIFIFEGEDSEHAMEVFSHGEKHSKITSEYWSPIVGSKQPSIIPAIKIYFKTNSVQNHGPNRMLLNSWYGPFNSNSYTVKVNWKDSVLVTARQVQEIWAYYLQSIFQGDEYRSEFYTTPYSYDCTLIPHYREFSIMYGEGYIWICTRRSVDGNTPQKQAATLDYVTARLIKSNQKKIAGNDAVKDGEIILVAFGFQANFFRWQVTGSDGAGSLVPYMHFEDCSKDEVRLKMESEMLTPLIKRIVKSEAEVSLPDRTRNTGNLTS